MPSDGDQQEHAKHTPAIMSISTPACQKQSFYSSVVQRDRGESCGHEQVTPTRAKDDPDLMAVDRALTLQGGQQVLAVLRGYKLIENRNWRIPVGWYAIHSGSQMITEERADRLRSVWPDAPCEEHLPHGAIMGLFYVCNHRTPEQCAPGYVWARGPICHIVSKAVEFAMPIKASGQKGLWQLDPWQISKIKEQLEGDVPIKNFDVSKAIGR